MSLSSANTSQHLTITAPGAAAVPSGPYTIGALYRNLAFAGSRIFYAYQPDDFSQVNMFFDGDLYLNFAQYDSSVDMSTQHWRWLVATKDGVSEFPRLHIGEYASSGALTWLHGDGNTAYGNFPNLNRFSIGDQFGAGFQGDLAALVAFTTEYDDPGVQSLFVRSSAAILAASPQFFVHWPQASGVTGPFASLAGGGTETIRSGTWTAGEDPPGYDFSLGRSGKPKIFGGSSWNAKQAKVWTGSTWENHQMLGHDGTDFVASK